MAVFAGFSNASFIRYLNGPPGLLWASLTAKTFSHGRGRGGIFVQASSTGLVVFVGLVFASIHRVIPVLLLKWDELWDRVAYVAILAVEVVGLCLVAHALYAEAKTLEQAPIPADDVMYQL